jgi:hypothetical protein
MYAYRFADDQCVRLSHVLVHDNNEAVICRVTMNPLAGALFSAFTNSSRYMRSMLVEVPVAVFRHDGYFGLTVSTLYMTKQTYGGKLYNLQWLGCGQRYHFRRR